jgi:hypothetical protein
MPDLLAEKINELRATGVHLFELIDGLKNNDLGVCRTPSAVGSTKSREYSDFALAHVARKIIANRRSRSEQLPAELFSEPAWDILLDLFIARMEQQQISISSACLASPVPTTTALRWLEVIQNLGLVERYPSPDDKRVTYVQLSSSGHSALRRYLSEVCEQAATAATSHVIEGSSNDTKLIANG